MDLFERPPQEEGVTINPRSILRMMIEKAEVQREDICFKLRSQNDQSYNVWVHKVLAILRVSGKILKVG